MDCKKDVVIKDILKVVIPCIDNLPTGKFIPSTWQPPTGFSDEKLKVGQIPVDHLVPQDKKSDNVILEFHGGGYLLALSDPWRDALIKYSNMAGNAEVYSVDYRVAPDFKYPVALEDAATVYKWLLIKGYDHNKIIVAGDSAGGNLALSLVLYLKDEGIALPKVVLAASPWTNAANDFPSDEFNYEKDLVLGKYGLKLGDQLFNPLYFEGIDVKNNPYVSPVLGDYKGFPSLLIQTGGYEVLLDDAKGVYQKAKDAGVNVKLTIYDDMPHDFQLVLSGIEESEKAWQEMQEFVETNM